MRNVVFYRNFSKKFFSSVLFVLFFGFGELVFAPKSRILGLPSFKEDPAAHVCFWALSPIMVPITALDWCFGGKSEPSEPPAEPEVLTDDFFTGREDKFLTKGELCERYWGYVGHLGHSRGSTVKEIFDRVFLQIAEKRMKIEGDGARRAWACREQDRMRRKVMVYFYSIADRENPENSRYIDSTAYSYECAGLLAKTCLYCFDKQYIEKEHMDAIKDKDFDFGEMEDYLTFLKKEAK